MCMFLLCAWRTGRQSHEPAAPFAAWSDGLIFSADANGLIFCFFQTLRLFVSNLRGKPALWRLWCGRRAAPGIAWTDSLLRAALRSATAGQIAVTEKRSSRLRYACCSGWTSGTCAEDRLPGWTGSVHCSRQEPRVCCPVAARVEGACASCGLPGWLGPYTSSFERPLGRCPAASRVQGGRA